jgi:SSS family solute:Na+ symporter
MSWIDWLVLAGTLLFIVLYGTIKSRKNTDIDDYLKNDRKLKWWQIGISVMATQASAITFISTPGQAYEDGMGFIQFYFGLPIAMIILIVFIIPIFHKLNVFTAYEYLENRFDVRVRQLTSLLFLIQRSLAAGITIYAPAIILSIVFGWSLTGTAALIGVLVIIYTVSGGSKAVSITQQQQMAIMMGGMIAALIFIIYKVTQFVPFEHTVEILKTSGKLNFIDTKFDLNNKYNIWSGLIAGTFLQLAYFGTDQSQVSRYLGGRSLREIKLGLTFNAIFKIPMQLLILFTGVMLFVFYIYMKPPVLFNTVELDKVRKSEYVDSLNQLEKSYDYYYNSYSSHYKLNDVNNIDEMQVLGLDYKNSDKEIKKIRKNVQGLMLKNNPKAITKDNDFVFVHFILNYMPVGMVGLLFAVILCAGMSSKSSELNALSAATIMDFYKRSFVKDKPESHYVKASKISTAIWGGISIGFALIFSLFDNLIEAVNIIGSLFYGVILGIFVTGFFLKRVTGTPLLIAALLSEIVVVITFILEKIDYVNFSYMWLNPLGCIGVMLFSLLLQPLFRKRSSV